MYGVKVDHLPPNTSYKRVREHFRMFGGIHNIVIKPASGGCYAFVNFYSNSSAQRAASEMDSTMFEGGFIACTQSGSRFVQERRSPETAAQGHTVKVTHLAKCTSKYSLRDLFGSVTPSSGDIHSVNVVQCPNAPFNHAYVKYVSQCDAENAVASFDNKILDGSQIRVKLHTGQVNQPFPKNSGVQLHTCTPPTTPQTTAAKVEFWHSSLERQRCSMSKPARTPTTDSCTVRVSMYGKITPEDIKIAFSHFGSIQKRLYVRGRDPSFTFVTFSTPQAAADACALHNTRVNNVKICVKIHIPQKQDTPTLKSVDKEIQCPQLAASIMQAKYKAELGRLESAHHVKIVVKPSLHCIKLFGKEEQVITAENHLKSLQSEISSRISMNEFELPCHSVPLFKQDSTFKKIAARHGVEFGVVTASTPVGLVSFCKKVKHCFDSTTTEQASTVPTCSKFASYLKEKTQTITLFVWSWQDDSGEYIPYSSNVSLVLNAAFIRSPSGNVTVKRGKYFIDFSKMTQTNITSKRSRQINSNRVQWFWHNGEAFLPYTAEHSFRIELMFQSSTPQQLHINGNFYSFDFDTMTQSSAHTQYKRKIERRVEEAPILSERVLTLQVSGLPECLDPALREVKEILEKATVEKECQLYAKSSNGFKARLVKNMNKYFVTTELVDDCLKLKGMPRYVERVHLLAEQEKIANREQQIQDGAVGMELPAQWSPQSEEVCLYKVQRNSDEWKKEVASIQKTLFKAAVVKLERIQNKWLWERYSFAKKQMYKKNKGCVNEKHLFHGTRTTPPEKVFRSEKGVDFRFSREGLWGMGSYFAVNASYSDRYAYHTTALGSNERQMLICKVLTGDSYNAEAKTDESLRQPPLKPVQVGSFEEERYDSVTGYTNGSYVYVVYDHEKVYPAYLMTYRPYRDLVL